MLSGIKFLLICALTSSNLVQLKRITGGSGGKASSLWAIFNNFFGKKAISIPLDQLQSHLKKTDFNFENPIEKIKLFNPPFIYNLSSKHFEILHVRLNFVSDLAQIGGN